MRNKKIIFFVLTLVIIILGVIFFVKQENYDLIGKDNEKLTQQELNDMEYVDDKIQKLTSSSNYEDLSPDDKKVEVEKLLKELKKDKYIKHYDYDNSNYMFSFEYKCGALGGVRLIEFDSMFN